MCNGVQCASTNDLDQNMCMHKIILFLARHSGYTKQKEATELTTTLPGSYLFSVLYVGKEVDYASFPFEDIFFFVSFCFVFVFFVFFWRNLVSAMIDKIRYKTLSTPLKDFLGWWIYDNELSTRINGVTNFNSLYKRTKTTERNQH